MMSLKMFVVGVAVIIILLWENGAVRRLPRVNRWMLYMILTVSLAIWIYCSEMTEAMHPSQLIERALSGILPPSR
ncbi:hypothetical protein Q5741_08445 [Paenibacillus sp. JX-17]|uniref:Uncharacterized protein n=1 Tax=Paenibacillus lacisoli TaxID=3064525 RepID=A0ABT9CC45_9BACL|nr:hypothetical protein [Paenibacillus sp. JX-17]MDO7906445.1 hypothetical protein [Paenibacillus sp. JX-17]